MNAQEWEKIKKNWEELLDVHPAAVISFLYSIDVLTQREKKEIESKKTTHQQMEKVLNTLNQKSQKHKAFKHLIEALKLDPVTNILANKILKTVSHADASLHSKADPHHLDSEVRTVLHQHFCNKQGLSTPLSEIRQVLKDERVFTGQNEWKDEILCEFLWKEFVEIDVETRKRQVGKSKKKVTYISNLGKIEPSEKIKPETKTEQQLDSMSSIVKTDEPTSRDIGKTSEHTSTDVGKTPEHTCIGVGKTSEHPSTGAGKTSEHSSTGAGKTSEHTATGEGKTKKPSSTVTLPDKNTLCVLPSEVNEQLLQPLCSAKDPVACFEEDFNEHENARALSNKIAFRNESEIEPVFFQQNTGDQTLQIEDFGNASGFTHSGDQETEPEIRTNIFQEKTSTTKVQSRVLGWLALHRAETQPELCTSEFPPLPSDDGYSSASLISDVTVSPKKVHEMSVADFKEFLKKKLLEGNHPTTICEVFEKEHVCGKIFLSMKEDDFQCLLPAVTFGTRRFLSLLIREALGPLQCDSEYLRKFDTEVKITDKYTKGKCADTTVNIRAKKTKPVRNFHLIEAMNKDNALEFIGSEVIPFASACLNDRRNGTIYFGINPSKSETYKAGEIVGVSLIKEEVTEEINEFILKSFQENQMNLVRNTVRDACFIPVVSEFERTPNMWVIEVDIVASSSILEKETIWTKLAMLPIYKKKRRGRESALFKFSDEGFPILVPQKEMPAYEKEHLKLVEQRKIEESQQQEPPVSNLRIRLLNLLTGGPELIQDTIFPFIVTSPIDADIEESSIPANISFIKHLHPEVVFDFDPSGSNKGIYKFLNENMNVYTTDNFDKSKTSKEDFNKTVEYIADESKAPWVFCNGYEALSMEPLSPTDWNQQRSNGFQECINCFLKHFDKDRIILIICLFSKNYECLLEGCDELLRKLPENWILLAECEAIASHWKQAILQRNRVSLKDLEDRCVVGMPWEQINTTISLAVKKTDFRECHLASSTGGFIPVREKKLEEWRDLGVLTSVDFCLNEEEKEFKRKDVEEKFYKGDQVDWLNFWFPGQVLKREVHANFLTIVKQALTDRYTDEEVVTISIYHQPGAGGTTSTKHVLWELRTEFRCCVVHSITEHTCEQIDQFKRYKDDSPKPIVIMIDNEDEEKSLQLRRKLLEMSRNYFRYRDEKNNIYAVVLLCIRQASLPKQLKDKQIAVRQELTDRELDWFEQKHAILTTMFQKNQHENINPKFLISFNILRENFKHDYVSKVIKEFSDDVKNENEVKLLKIVSFLNTYDPDFKEIPVSCLDGFFVEFQTKLFDHSPLYLARAPNWEANLSQAVKVLLNVSSNRRQTNKTRNVLRVFNKIIAREILYRMKERTGQKEIDIMKEIMNCGIFENETHDSKKLQNIIANIIKKREFKEDGLRRAEFSTFIIELKATEGVENTAQLMESLFSLNNDAFTAQVIARFYIDDKQWGKAEEYASKAINIHPNNSFLYHTYGQVFKSQLFQEVTSDRALKNEKFDEEKIHRLFTLVQKCIPAFRKGQEVSEQEASTFEENNFAGYFGEIRSILLFLEGLHMCPPFNEYNLLHALLVKRSFMPKRLEFLKETEMQFLKNLENYSRNALRRLEDEFLHVKRESNLDSKPSRTNTDKNNLIELKVNLDNYFGETSNTVPPSMNVHDACEFRLRRARQLGGSSLFLMINLKQTGKTKELSDILQLMTQNLQVGNCSFETLITLLHAITVLSMDQCIPPGLTFRHVQDWSKQCYNNNQSESQLKLETFLYFVFYNFPTAKRRQYVNFTPELASAISKWKSLFDKKYTKCISNESTRRKKENTIFYLGSGVPLMDVVYYKNIDFIKKFPMQERWHRPELRHYLALFSGTLLQSGKEVFIKDFKLAIPTAYAISKTEMFQKTVFFYLGFSFAGPKAYGMSLKEPSILPFSASIHRTISSETNASPRLDLTMNQMVKQLKAIFSELERITDPKKKKELEKERDELNRKMCNLMED